MQKSNIFIISGPSGAGEDSIISGLRSKLSFEKIVTTTTRAMRPGETNGVEYYFISKEEFADRIEKGDFFEFAEEDGENYYGVTKEEIERVKALEMPIIWKIEYKGVIFAKKMMPEVTAILLDVPIETIERRIRERDKKSEEYVLGRLEYAKGWYENRDKFDFCVKNEDGKLEEAINEVADIINRVK